MNIRFSSFVIGLISMLLTLSTSYAQSFNISSIGEMDLDTDLIANDHIVTKYFGMYVDGSGQGGIRVTIGDQSAERDYTFQLSTTRFTAFIFANDLAEEVAITFRRGVFGSVQIDILEADGAVSASEIITLDVTLKKSNCKKHPSSQLKQCKRVDLGKATKRQKKQLVKKFLSSIRGPIILEP